METENNFDLSRALASWRRELLAQGEILPDEIRELESHLRSSMEGLQQRGLKEEEAFWLARRRLGPGEKLAAEFARAKPYRLWRCKLSWLTAGVVGAYLWTTGLSYFQEVLCKNLVDAAWWLPELAVFAILTGAIVWLASTRARGCCRSVGRTFSSPGRIAFGWFLLVVIGLRIAWVTSQHISQPSPGMSGGMMLIGASIASFYDSFSGAVLSLMMILAMFGLNWRWKRLAAKQAME